MTVNTAVDYVLFLNTYLAFSCSGCILIGLWPFRGLFHSWMFSNSVYTWTTHVQMGWFDVGCIGLFVTNLQALTTFTDNTGAEAYRSVFVTNAIMHALWGVHNLQMAVRKFRDTDKGTVNELRRAWPCVMWSVVGACGSGMVRNIYAAAVDIDDISVEFVIVTGVWELLALGIILIDLGYYLIKEQGCSSWGNNVATAEMLNVSKVDGGDAGAATPTSQP